MLLDCNLPIIACYSLSQSLANIFLLSFMLCTCYLVRHLFRCCFSAAAMKAALAIPTTAPPQPPMTRPNLSHLSGRSGQFNKLWQKPLDVSSPFPFPLSPFLSIFDRAQKKGEREEQGEEGIRKAGTGRLNRKRGKRINCSSVETECSLFYSCR